MEITLRLTMTMTMMMMMTKRYVSFVVVSSVVVSYNEPFFVFVSR